MHVFSSWNDGVLVNFTVATKEVKGAVDACTIWDNLRNSLRSSANRLAAGALEISADSEQLSPCAPPPNLCGSALCKTELGEVCLAGNKCAVDYCSDVDFCPRNTSCVNYESRSECECESGFVDIRASEAKTAAGP